MKKLFLVSTIVLLAAGCSTAQPSSNNSNNPPAQQSQGTSATQNPTTDVSGEKTFTVTGQNYSFTPTEIKVNKGDKVKIVFQNSGGFHDFVIDEFNVKTASIASGDSATVEFTADKTGTFTYYCSVANHRAMGMQGNLIVQ